MPTTSKLELLWSAHCAVKLSLGGNNGGAPSSQFPSHADVMPLYVLVPRVSYLLLGLQAQIRHFRKLAVSIDLSGVLGDSSLFCPNVYYVSCNWHAQINRYMYIAPIANCSCVDAQVCIHRYSDVHRRT
jgi:hypothetical protein